MQGYLLVVFVKFGLLLGHDIFLIVFEGLCDIVSFGCNHVLDDLHLNGLLFFERRFAFRFLGLLSVCVLVMIKDIEIMTFELEFD